MTTTAAVDGLRLKVRRPRAVHAPAAWLLLSSAVMALAVWQVARGSVWRVDFFFDEMWRVDFIRSSNIRAEMLTHNTPIPYGWLVLMRGLTAGLPYEPFYWRAITGASMVLGLLVIGTLLMRLGRPEQRLHPMVCAVAIAALAFMTPVRSYVAYFNNYGFEVLYTALVLLATMELPRSRRALPTFCVLLALSPLMVIGPLFVVPTLVGYALLWAWRSPDLADRRRRLSVLSVALVAAVADLVFVQLAFYGPMNSTSAGLKNYWITRGGSLGGSASLWALLGSLCQQLRDAVVGPQLLDAGGAWLWLATAVVIAGALVGTVAVARRWPCLLVAVGSAQLLTIPASAAIGWPINVQRVNICFQVLLLAVVAIGIGHGLLLLVRRLHAPAWSCLPGFGLLLAALWFPHVPAGTTVFGRGLYADLGLVVQNAGPRNLVFQYNAMGRFEAHDRLINTGSPGHTFDLIVERAGDGTLFRPLDQVIAAAHLNPGDKVWCVIPFEIGPAKYRKACQISDPSLAPSLDTKASRSIVRSYVVG